MDAERLIELIQNYPVLYDFSNTSHKNKNIKDKAWEEIATKMGKYITVMDCKKKWKNIRDVYKKVKNKEKLGSGSACVGGSSKYSDDRFHFLERAATVQETLSTVDEPTIQGPDVSNIKLEESLQEEVEDIPTKRKATEELEVAPAGSKRKTEVSFREKFMKEFMKGRQERMDVFRSTQLQPTETPNDTFFRCMAGIVNKLPANLAVEARMKVHTLISDLELKALEVSECTEHY